MNEYKVNMPYSAPVPSAQTAGQNDKRLALIATVLSVIFALLFFIFLGLYLNLAGKYRAARDDGMKIGKAEQSRLDNEKLRLALENPYKTYVAPDLYGAFSVTFPRNWNISLSEDTSGSALNLILNPDIIRTTGSDNRYASKISYTTAKYSDAVKKYDDLANKGTIKSKPVVVSGITGTRYEGKMNEKFASIVTVIQVRDKILTITTDDTRFQPEYDQILTQLMINR